MLHEVLATPIFDFGASLQDRFPVATGVGFHRDVLVLSLPKIPQYRSADGTHALKFSEEPNFYHVHHWINDALFEVDFTPLNDNIHHIQPLPDEKYLLGRGRGSENIHEFNAEGKWICTWNGGDAIEDIQVAADGKVWISHFDEGYGEPDSDGLKCFDASHQKVFDFNEQGGDILDCYMLNVVSPNKTWLCPYTDFPLIHLRDFKTERIYKIPEQMTGSNAFAVHRGLLLFAGGYHFRNQLFWHDLHRNRTVEIAPLNENGEAVVWKRAQGRGGDLFLWGETQVWRLNLEEIWP